MNTPNFHGRQARLGYAALFEARGAKANAEKRAICADCPVQHQCLTWALHNEKHGFWAGLGATARKRMRTELGIQPTFDTNGAPRA